MVVHLSETILMDIKGWRGAGRHLANRWIGILAGTAYWNVTGNGVFRPNTNAIVQLDTGQKESAEVQNWLDAAIPATEEAIYISWEPDLSVETDRTIFVTWWDTFCYPSSYNVLIQPVSSTWAAYYWHEEVMYVGLHA